MESPKFKLPKAGLIVFVLMAGTVVVLATRLNLSPEAWGRLSGSLMGMLLFASLLSWVGWRLARRSDAVKNIVFLLVILLSGAGRVAEVARRPSIGKGLENMTSLVADHQKSLKEEFEETGMIDPGAERTDRLIENIESSAAGTQGMERVLLDAMAVLLKAMQGPEKEYQKAYESLDMVAIMRPAQMTNKAQIDPLRLLVTNFIQANVQLKQAVLDGTELLKAELEKGGLSQKNIDTVMRGYLANAGKRNRLVAEIRDQDVALGTNFLGMLDLFESQWGHWKCADSETAPEFEDEGSQSKYAGFIENIGVQADAQEESQKKLIEFQEKVMQQMK